MHEKEVFYERLDRVTWGYPIGIGAWAIGGGKWDTKGMNESAN